MRRRENEEGGGLIETSNELTENRKTWREDCAAHSISTSVVNVSACYPLTGSPDTCLCEWAVSRGLGQTLGEESPPKSTSL